ncbi:MAG: indolepyruvate ferredoxin oxidoreductase family protein [Alphaproteobacteria bacterium]|nr:MAG: indolepyruvate ferredoxin oxidoreductase family protein [Alphaproteobacteria bacterium]
MLTKPELLSVALDDKYTLEKGRVFMTGIQALVRLPLMQRVRDVRAGLNTAGFISGYRGSPLGGVDQALWKAQKYLDTHHIHFEPGINEDLAATAVWGTQQIDLTGGTKYDGVFGMWYGKGPGIDRSSDAIKHANLAGTMKNGGVLMVTGDDHACKSSTLAHQSEFAFMDFMTPFLNPAGIQEILDYGMIGWAMSRFTGLWIGLKIVSDTADSSASVEVHPDRGLTIIPKDFPMPPGGLNQRGSNWPPVGLEELLHYHKVPAAKEFVRVNKLDQIIWNPPKARLGIVSTGKSYLDVRQALFELGIDEKAAMDLGIRLYKVAMPWPLEPTKALEFAQGLEEIFVAEEKRDVMEHQFKNILYGQPGMRPRIVGKLDENGAILLPSIDELSSSEIAVAIAARIAKFGDYERIQNKAKSITHILDARNPHTISFNRIPYYCSGCPHNTSTNVPEGSTALAGIGCHIMSLWMDRRTSTVTQMGGEGVTWVGQAPFSSTNHVFANLGDGTYYHSGLMAIRAAIAANVNITYKILYNDAVAMTGGQPVEGGLSVPQITRQLEAEGVQKVVVVSDYPEHYPLGAGFAHGVTIHHRSELDQLQRDLREHPGVTALIYDQTCAAEKRRRRKRGEFYDPPRRIFINDQVCEGCGDCSVKSNCLSVTPVETEFGRKRAIDQSTCNKDYSCVKGFCPSFVSVMGGKLRKNKSGNEDPSGAGKLPLPKIPSLDHPISLLVDGVGGTGVVTIGALLGMAAHLEGKGCTTMDMTGLAQKGGSVWSPVRIGPKPQDMYAVRIGTGAADYIIGADLVVTANDDTMDKMQTGKTRALVNSNEAVTGNFPRNPDLHFPSLQMTESIQSRLGQDHVKFFNATRVATGLLGDSIATNLFMLGYAFQLGWIPLHLESILRAIELNQVSVDMNKQAFAWGRKAAIDWESVEKLVRPKHVPPHHIKSESLDEAIDRRVKILTDYQNAKYAKRYKDMIQRVRRAEQERVGGKDDLSWAVTKYLFKLMAYKDEYEVARLYSNGQFLSQLRQQFDGDYKLKFHLAPPLLAPRDDKGHLQKMTFGSWMLPAFGVLAKFRFLRGTPFDIFGHTAERRMERKLAEDYENTIDMMLGRLSPGNHKMAVEWANIPEHIRGYGHIKEAHLAKIQDKQAKLRDAFLAG